MALFTTNNLDKTDHSKGGIIGNDDTNDFLICKGPEKLKSLINKIKENKTTWYVSDGDCQCMI